MMRLALLLCLLPLLPDPLPQPRIQADKDPTKVTVEAKLPADALKDLPAGKWTQDQGETWLRFAVVKKDGTGLPMVGTYQRKDDLLSFVPRYPLEPGTLYRASFGTDAAKAASSEYRVPERAQSAPATIVKILPSGDVLPANHLKLYVYFSAPMRGGRDIFDQICIIDADGNEVADPWLRDELWDEKDQVLIIYIHPGRIKWGLLLRETLGPVLLPDKDYSFVVRGTMLDAMGQKLGKDHVKKFRTTAEERTRIPMTGWKLQAPVAGSRQPLKVEFPRVLDHIGQEKFLVVKDAAGQVVKGTIAVGAGEKTWSFTPQEPWRAGEHGLHVDPRLEDVAGNTPVRPFDVDLKAPEQKAQSLVLKFTPGK
jgi:hypothetical protein